MGHNEENVNMRQCIMRNNMMVDSHYQGWATSSVAGTVIPISRMTSQVWRGCSEPEKKLIKAIASPYSHDLA